LTDAEEGDEPGTGGATAEGVTAEGAAAEGAATEGPETGGAAAGLSRMVSPALPVTITLKIFLSFGKKAYLMPAISTETMIKAAHILLKAMR
jgi:hypothetical protein